MPWKNAMEVADVEWNFTRNGARARHCEYTRTPQYTQPLSATPL